MPAPFTAVTRTEGIGEPEVSVMVPLMNWPATGLIVANVVVAAEMVTEAVLDVVQ